MPLFDGTTEQFRQYVSVSLNFTLDSVMSELEQTESRMLRQFLGDGLADQIIGLADLAPGSLNRNKKQALHLARTAVARVGFAAYLPFAEVQIGDDGVTVSAIEGRKAAFEYQTNKLERNLLEVGWRALDELIALVASMGADFPAWPESPYYTEHVNALFRSPKEFSRFYPIQDRWLTFWAMRPFIRAVEEDRGATGLDQIKQLPTTLPTDAIEALKRKLMRAVAYQAVIEALPNLSIELNGVNVQVNYGSQFGNAQYYQPPGKDHLTWVLTNLQKQTDLAWSAFDTAFDSLQPKTGAEDMPTGLVYSTGAITLL